MKEKITIEEKIKKIRQGRDLSFLDLCSIDDLQKSDLELIFSLTREFKKQAKTKFSFLKNHTIFNAFFENSTRTRSSFELAGKKLSADVINIAGSSASIKKGETLLDTAETLDAYQSDVIVVRTAYSGVPYFLSKHVKAAIINAGDGLHEHPSQGILDAFTMTEHHKSLKNKIILIVGDILHSRVAGSLLRIIPLLGGKIRIASSETFIPRHLKKTFKCDIFYDLEKAIENVDVIYNIRVQRERGSNGFIPTIREFSKSFSISPARFAKANKNAMLMDAGPIMRDVGVHSALVPHQRSFILRQVQNGLAIRQTLLWLLIDRHDKRKKSFEII